AIGTIFCDHLNDRAQAYDGLLEAYRLDPRDLRSARKLSELARELGRWSSFLREADAALEAERDADCEVVRCEQLVAWRRGDGAEPALTEPYLVRVRRIRPGHPLVHRRLVYAGDNRAIFAERDQLEDAIAISRDDDEKARLRVELGELHE